MTIKEEVSSILRDGKVFVQFPLASVIGSLKRNPDIVLLKKGNILALKAILKLIWLFKEADMNVKSLEETLVDMYMVMIRRSVKMNHSKFSFIRMHHMSTKMNQKYEVEWQIHRQVFDNFKKGRVIKH